MVPYYFLIPRVQPRRPAESNIARAIYRLCTRLPKEPLCERLPPPPPPGVETLGEDGLLEPGERTLALAVRKRSPWLVLAPSAAAPLPMSADMPAMAEERPSSEEPPAL